MLPLPFHALAASALAAEPSEQLVVEETARRGADPLETPASVTVLAIDGRLPLTHDLAELLDGTAGMAVQRLGGLGDFSAATVRGSTMRQVEVCIDGVPLNPDGSSVVDLSELPLWAFDRVEVYRGDPPPELDASPVGGVVNLVSADPVPERTTAALTYGSYDTGRLVATGGARGLPGGIPSDLLLAADAFMSGGDFRYFDDDGTLYNLADDRFRERENADERQLAAHARWRLGTPGRRVSAVESFLSREQGVPGPSTNPTSQVRYAVTRELAVLQLDAGTGGWAGRLRASGLLRREELDDRAGEIGTGDQRTRDDVLDAGLLASLRAAPAPGLSGGLTISTRRQMWRTTDLVLDEEGEARERTAIHAAARATFRAFDDRLSISPTGRLSFIDDRELGTSSFGELALGPGDPHRLLSVDPTLGALVQLGPWLALKATGGRYLRPPDLDELFGNRGVVEGNPDLVPERGWRADAGAALEIPAGLPLRGQAEAAYFRGRTRDLIQYVQNAQGSSVPVNLGDTFDQGVELGATLELWRVVESSTALTWNDSVNLSPDPAYAGNRLPYLPVLEIEQRTAVHAGERWRAGHTWSYASPSYWDATNWYASTPRSIHGLFVRLRPLRGGPEIELDLLNATDHVVEVVPRNPLDPADTSRVVQPLTDFVGYPLPGRSVYLSVRWSGEDHHQQQEQP